VIHTEPLHACCACHGAGFRPVVDSGEDDETGAIRLR
jgi:hypothetical protein